MRRGLRIAVVGSGPSGMYAIEHLLKQSQDIEIDLYERLPTPGGLVRFGVAPDHPEKKQIIDRAFNYYLAHPKVRLLANLEVGKDVSHSDLSHWYHAVIYAVGASKDKQMKIPGEDLPGSWAAREFVAWYSGHPDFSHLEFDLSCERAVIVGNGNVALDVARILTLSPQQLAKTDISERAMVALQGSNIKEVVILGRRGPLAAAFHNPELEELRYLEGVYVQVDEQQLPNENELSSDQVNWGTRRKIQTLRSLSVNKEKGASKQIVFRFFSSPVELIGANKLKRIVIADNSAKGVTKACQDANIDGKKLGLEVGILFRAIGYRGVALPGLPFDEKRGVIDNNKGRVGHNGNPVVGTYVTGWIKNGPRGIIGTNKQCALESVNLLMEDAKANRLSTDAMDSDFVLAELKKRKPDLIEFANWRNIDQAETTAGAKLGRPRLKITDLEKLLDVANLSVTSK